MAGFRGGHRLNDGYAIGNDRGGITSGSGIPRSNRFDKTVQLIFSATIFYSDLAAFGNHLPIATSLQSQFDRGEAGAIVRVSGTELAFANRAVFVMNSQGTGETLAVVHTE